MIDFAYLKLLLRLVFVGALTNPRLFLGMSLGMFVQNLMFFAFWIIFLSGIHDIDGWYLPQIAVFQGVGAMGIGLAFLFANGARWIGNTVMSGEMDIYLSRPRNPLLQVLTLHSDPSTAGDIAYGLVILAVFGKLTAFGWLLSMIAALCVAILFVAVSILLDSLIFFMAAGSEIGEKLFRTVATLSNIPQHTQGIVVRVLLYSVLPAGFIVILPVEAVRQDSAALISILMLAAGGYMAAAIWVFHRGLRRYTSATGWSA